MEESGYFLTMREYSRGFVLLAGFFIIQSQPKNLELLLIIFFLKKKCLFEMVHFEITEQCYKFNNIILSSFKSYTFY